MSFYVNKKMHFLKIIFGTVPASGVACNFCQLYYNLYMAYVMNWSVYAGFVAHLTLLGMRYDFTYKFYAAPANLVEFRLIEGSEEVREKICSYVYTLLDT